MQMKLRNYSMACYQLYWIFQRCKGDECVWFSKNYSTPTYAKKAALKQLADGSVFCGDWEIKGFRIVCLPFPYVRPNKSNCNFYDFDVSGECIGQWDHIQILKIVPNLPLYAKGYT